MQEQDNTTLTWFKVMKTMVDSNVENLTAEENGWLMGVCLQAYMENRDIPFPGNCSPVLRYAARALQKEVANSLKALQKRIKDGQAGGNKKAANAQKKAVEDAERGIYIPPKKTAFLTMCQEVLREYGRKSEWEFPLLLKQEDRPDLFEDFCEEQSEDKPTRNEDEVKAYILCHAFVNYLQDNTANGEDQCFRVFAWLYNHRELTPFNFADAISHMDLNVAQFEPVRFGLQEDDKYDVTWYDTAEDFLAAFYEEDNEEVSSEEPPAAQTTKNPVFKGWGIY